MITRTDIENFCYHRKNEQFYFKKISAGELPVVWVSPSELVEIAKVLGRPIHHSGSQPGMNWLEFDGVRFGTSTHEVD